MKLSICLAVSLLIASTIGSAQGPQSPTGGVQQLAFLLGDWSSATDTELGRADAVVSFSPDVDGHVVVRRNHVKYTSGRAGGTEHGDLMIMYDAPAGSTGSPLRAIYFDNESHVIRYIVTIPSANTAVFESDPADPGPRFRLTQLVSGDELRSTFEIAAPGQPFKTYVSGTSTRRR